VPRLRRYIHPFDPADNHLTKVEGVGITVSLMPLRATFVTRGASAIR
jgi:hypothetical protein